MKKIELNIWLEVAYQARKNPKQLKELFAEFNKVYTDYEMYEAFTFGALIIGYNNIYQNQKK